MAIKLSHQISKADMVALLRANMKQELKNALVYPFHFNCSHFVRGGQNVREAIDGERLNGNTPLRVHALDSAAIPNQSSKFDNQHRNDD